MPSELISQILQTSLYPTEGAESYAFVPQSDTTDDDNGALGSFEITKNWFPENCKVVGLPAGVAFLDELVKSVLTLRPQYTFVLPPFISRRNLPDNLQRDYPRLDGWGICLKMLVGNLIPNSVFGVLLPQGFFLGESARAFREELFQEVKPSLVITDEELVTELGLPIHSRFKMGILIATNMLEPATPLRFLGAYS